MNTDTHHHHGEIILQSLDRKTMIVKEHVWYRVVRTVYGGSCAKPTRSFKHAVANFNTKCGL